MQAFRTARDQQQDRRRSHHVAPVGVVANELCHTAFSSLASPEEALAIESEIWKFRTRTGTYTTKQITNAGSFSNEAEEKLKTFLEDMKSHVLKSASILETAMFASMEMFDYPESAQKYNHGKFLCAEPVSGL